MERYAGQPQTAWALHTKADILLQLHRPDDARAIFDLLIEKYSSNLTAVIDAHMGIAGIARDAGQTGDAVERYRLVAEKFIDYPQAAQAMTALAQIYQEQGRDKELQAVLERLLELTSADSNTIANGRITLATLFARQRKTRAALEQYAHVYNDFPKTTQAAWAMTSAARLLNENGDQSGAVKLFEQVIADFPENHEAVIGAKAALEQIYER
ncbi:MAG: tetratricopeptide repeat protein [Deltaproteobacteria bacterium]|nr:tetratricopeptide repeat protein [Deltaproteobacteria bacterium]